MTTVTSHPDQKRDHDHLTTTLMNPLRTPSISVDLMPVEVFVSRRTRQIARLAGFALVVVAMLLSVWYGVEVLRTTGAEDERDATLDSVQSLKRQQSRFDELVRTQAQARAINAQLTALMANDVQWSQLVAGMTAVVPDGVDLTGVTASIPAVDATSDQVTNIIGPPTVKLVGSLTVNGVGESKTVIARYVDALATVPGLANVFLTSAALGENGFQFAIRVDIATTALDNRYKPTTGASAGAGQ